MSNLYSLFGAASASSGDDNAESPSSSSAPTIAEPHGVYRRLQDLTLSVSEPADAGLTETGEPVEIERPPRPQSRCGDPSVDNWVASNTTATFHHPLMITIAETDPPPLLPPLPTFDCSLCRPAFARGDMRPHTFELCPRRRTVISSRLYREDRRLRILDAAALIIGRRSIDNDPIASDTDQPPVAARTEES